MENIKNINGTEYIPLIRNYWKKWERQEWKKQNNGERALYKYIMFECSNCGEFIDKPEKFCPNCGALSE